MLVARGTFAHLSNDEAAAAGTAAAAATATVSSAAPTRAAFASLPPVVDILKRCLFHSDSETVCSL